MIKQYLYNVGVWASQGISVFLGGHPDESLSQRIGRAYLYHQLNNTWWFYLFAALRWFVNLLFKPLGEEDHILESLTGEPNAKELWEWGEIEARNLEKVFDRNRRSIR